MLMFGFRHKETKKVLFIDTAAEDSLGLWGYAHAPKVFSLEGETEDPEAEEILYETFDEAYDVITNSDQADGSRSYPIMVEPMDKDDYEIYIKIVNGWIGVDLDGTLAEAIEAQSWDINKVGRAIPGMLEKVRRWLGQGKRIKIFTARVSMRGHKDSVIQDWLETYGLPRLEITNVKDVDCVEIWDDIAVRVVLNEGKPDGKTYINQ